MPDSRRWMTLRQQLDCDEVETAIAAPIPVVYQLVADVTRMSEFSPYIRSVVWIDGHTGPAVGARFKAVNKMGRGPAWTNRPVITVFEPNSEFAFERWEPFLGTIEWRYRFDAVDEGTRLIQSYRVVRPVSPLGWFVIGVLYRIKDDRATLRVGMLETLERVRTAAVSDAARQQT